MRVFNLFITDTMITFKSQKEAEAYQQKLKKIGLKSSVKTWSIPGFKSKDGGQTNV